LPASEPVNPEQEPLGATAPSEVSE
jgi:hypothetical protein